MLFLAIWAPQNGPKKVHIGLQVGGMYGPIFKLKNKPVTKSVGPLFKKKWSKTTRKQVFTLFFVILGNPNGPKKACKGPQLDRMYGPMSKFKDKPLTRSLGLFH
jgi:hypothetical protein